MRAIRAEGRCTGSGSRRTCKDPPGSSMPSSSRPAPMPRTSPPTAGPSSRRILLDRDDRSSLGRPPRRDARHRPAFRRVPYHARRPLRVLGRPAPGRGTGTGLSPRSTCGTWTGVVRSALRPAWMARSRPASSATMAGGSASCRVGGRSGSSTPGRVATPAPPIVPDVTISRIALPGDGRRLIVDLMLVEPSKRGDFRIQYFIRVWDAETGHPLSPPLSHPSQVNQAELSADGARLLTVNASMPNARPRRGCGIWPAVRSWPGRSTTARSPTASSPTRPSTPTAVRWRPAGCTTRGSGISRGGGWSVGRSFMGGPSPTGRL